MKGKDTLFPLSGQIPIVRVTAVLFIFLTTSLLLTAVLYGCGSFFFPQWTDARNMLNAGEVTGVAPKIIRYLQTGQEFAVFIIPSLLISYAMKFDFTSEMGLKKRPPLVAVFFVLVLVFFVIVLNTFLAWLNSRMILPHGWSHTEEWIRAKEFFAEKYTIVLTSKASSPSLLTNIIIVALLPAIGEEFFFRGVIQKLFAGFMKNGNAAVWLTAIIFSTIHLQFYGFVPRLLLGLIFGYLFLWSGSIWLPAIAHFVNNMVPVVIAYLKGWKEATAITENYVNTSPVTILFAVCAIVVTLYFIRRELEKSDLSK